MGTNFMMCTKSFLRGGALGAIVASTLFASLTRGQGPTTAVVTNTLVNYCNDPHPSVGSFLPTDTRAVVFVSFNNPPAGSMSLAWFGPGHVFYGSASWSSIDQYSCFQSSLMIAGTSAATMIGAWSVEVYLNNTTIAQMAFSIASNSTSTQQTVGYPVTNPHVNSNCHFRGQCVGGPGDEHTGMDFTSNDSNIYAAADGSVMIMQVNGVGCTCHGAGCGCQDHGLGNAIVLEHTRSDGSKFYTLYGHNAAFASNLAVGRGVHKGDVIATMGGTGYGLPDKWVVHCHFEVKSDPPRLGNPVGTEIYFGYTHNSQDPALYGYFDPATYIDAVVVSGSALCVGCGAPTTAISAIFQNAYNLEAGNLGTPTSLVTSYADAFYSPSVSGYYQTFIDGQGRAMSLQLSSGANQAFSVKWGFANLYGSVARYNSPVWHVYDLVVAPTSNEAGAASPSVGGTIYTFQPFLRGSMYFFNSGGFASIGWGGTSEYVWGEFSLRYEREGGKTGQLGLPVSDAWDNGQSGTISWSCQWFERGYICRGKDASVSAIYTIASAYSMNLLDANGNWNANGGWTDLGWVQY